MHRTCGYMRTLLSLTFILFISSSFGQTKECFCVTDSFMNHNTTNCKKTVLKNGQKFYWQFNCKKIWLTLEFKNGRKITIDKVPLEYYSYTYRLGYHLFKEFSKTLLFRSGCPANGPCNFVLIDKSNGQKISEFGELIYDHTTDTIYDFILYLSSKSMLTLHYIDTGKKYKIKIDSKQINAVVPEYVFGSPSLSNNLLTLEYGTKKLLLDLSEYRC
jgi:hypothetical protein